MPTSWRSGSPLSAVNSPRASAPRPSSRPSPRPRWNRCPGRNWPRHHDHLRNRLQDRGSNVRIGGQAGQLAVHGRRRSRRRRDHPPQQRARRGPAHRSAPAAVRAARVRCRGRSQQCSRFASFSTTRPRRPASACTPPSVPPSTTTPAPPPCCSPLTGRSRSRRRPPGTGPQASKRHPGRVTGELLLSGLAWVVLSLRPTHSRPAGPSCSRASRDRTRGHASSRST
jgi:hypothetical protein